MNAVLKFEHSNDAKVIHHGFGTHDIFFLNKIRMSAMRCRSSARLDMFEACRLVANTGCENQDIIIESMLRTMRQGLQKSAIFLAPNSDELSFDESWLLRCIASAQRNDYASLSFLIKSRVSLPYRRSMAFLIHKVSECFT